MTKYRDIPISVQLIDLEMPLVEVGGKRFDTLQIGRASCRERV